MPSLPPFDADGNLPPGIHDADWEEVKTRFGFTGHRRALLRGLQAGLILLKAVGCRRVYLDGSFVTAKRCPGDFDACWEEAGVDDTALDEVFFDLKFPRAKQKARFGGEFFPASAPASGRSRFLSFFQQTSEGSPKGIVSIDLTRWQP